ncbi:MFS transporter [Streptomyces albireticuli]|nr:MFS transporter [Streptomyces albireticuli]MCD9194367.1 MFS transporter [Streptomyces albireticuli]
MEAQSQEVVVEQDVNQVMEARPAAPPAAGPPAAPESVFSGAYRALTVGVILSVSMVAFESLGVATVLPGIARHLDGLGAYGWGLSALMLANIVGTVVAGRSADRHGPKRSMAVGMAVFAVGCAVAGAAASWPLFLLGRALQGLGVGAVMSMAYTVIGLAYPEHLRARMFALLSSAWTVPSLVGPVIAGTLAEHTSWRGVFLLMLPLIAVAAALTLPGLRRMSRGQGAAGAAPAAGPWWKGPLAAGVLLTAGTALLLQALLLKNLALLIPLAVLGLAVAVPTLRQVTPAGTLGLRAGVGAGIGIRFLLCAVYFGSEAFLPLGLQELRDVSPAMAGLGLSAGAITWVIGSAYQARTDGRARGRTGSVILGFTILLAGVVIMALAVLVTAIPALVAVAGWAVGGIGMGIAFNAATTDTLEQAPAEQQGLVSGSLQLAQTLATGLIAGLGGAAIAMAHHHGSTTEVALVCTFVLTAALALAGVLLSRRLRPAPTR